MIAEYTVHGDSLIWPLINGDVRLRWIYPEFMQLFIFQASENSG